MTSRYQYQTPKATGRYSCKCRLCGQKWTTEESYIVAAYASHECASVRHADLVNYWSKSRDITSALYQVAASYFVFRPIMGTLNTEKACGARCLSATGHNCECSCGGENHGVNAH